jgi:hypothetical protein
MSGAPLQVLVAALLLASFAYGVRKQAERARDRRRALVEEEEPQRIEGLDAAVAELQAHVHAGKLARRPEIIAAARAAIAHAGLGALYEPDVVPGGVTGWRIEVRPRALGGSLEGWLRAHAALALLAVPAVLAHARLEAAGPVTAALLLCFLATTATGVVAGALRWLGQRGPEIDALRTALEGLEAGLAETVPGTGRAAALLEERRRILAAHPVAHGRLRLLDALIALHLPLAWATLGLALVHAAAWTYF